MKISNLVSLLAMAGAAVAVFSPSDIEFINSQKNYETRIKQMKIDYDQKVRDLQDSFGRDKATWQAAVDDLTARGRKCAQDQATWSASQGSFFARLTTLFQNHSTFNALLGANFLDAQGRIRDLQAAGDLLEAVFRNADAADALAKCRSDVNACSQSITTLRVQFTDIQTKFTQADSAAKDCDAQRQQLDAANRQCAANKAAWDRQLKTISDELDATKRAAADATAAAQQCNANLAACTKAVGSAQNETRGFRGKLQFLFDIAGYCRQNFGSLAQDKAQIIASLNELRTFVSKMDASSIQGDLQSKFEWCWNERSQFRKKVELIAIVLNAFSQKVDDYTKILAADGYDKILAGGDFQGQISFSSTDFVDINNISDLNSCMSAIKVFRDKLSVMSSNLNTEIKNKNDCLSKFNDMSNQLIGEGYENPY